jgi:hypothetical protein
MLRRLHNDAINVIASALHYQDHTTGFSHGMVKPDVDRERMTAMQVRYMSEGWEERYRRESMFHARVDCIVAALIQTIESNMEQEVRERVYDALKNG